VGFSSFALARPYVRETVKPLTTFTYVCGTNTTTSTRAGESGSFSGAGGGYVPMPSDVTFREENQPVFWTAWWSFK
jgi:hypothetical protein